MSEQLTHRRVTRGVVRTLAVGVAVATLVGIASAGQALATLAPPDERVLERQGRIKHQPAAGQADEEGRVTLPPQLSGEDKAAVAQVEREHSQRSPAGTRQRFTRPEPSIGPGQQLDDEQVAPRPVRTAPPDARGGLVVSAVVGALLLAVGAATTWRVRHRRPQPESTA